MAGGLQRALLACVVPVLFGCGSQTSDAARRQAENRRDLATNLLMDGNFAAALREARRSLELDPECTACRITLATIYAARNELPSAERELLAVLQSDPGNPYAQNTLAAVYLNLARPADAEPLASAAAENEDFNGRHLAYYNLGWARMERGNNAEAIDAFDQALAENPRMCAAYYRIGEVHLREGRHEAAVSALQRAVQMQPDAPTGDEQRPVRTCNDMPEAHWRLGQAFDGLGRTQDAIPEFTRCVQLASADRQAEPGASCRERLTALGVSVDEALQGSPGGEPGQESEVPEEPSPQGAEEIPIPEPSDVPSE